MYRRARSNRHQSNGDAVPAPMEAGMVEAFPVPAEAEMVDRDRRDRYDCKKACWLIRNGPQGCAIRTSPV